MRVATRKSVTLRDVAALAGIDKATASRALNGKGYLSPQTREAAYKAALQLGFEPDLHAQRLAQGRNHNIVGLLSASDLGVANQQVWFLQHRLDELGFEVEIHQTPLYVSHSVERQVALVNKLRRQQPGAIICEASLAPEALEELRIFIKEGGFVVGHGEAVALDCDQVLFEGEHRAYMAARHLIELGHREIGFCFHGPVSTTEGYFMGFKRALAESGLTPRTEWLFAGGNYEEGGARLAEAFLQWPQRPTGLCIINDVSASTFVTTLARHGLSVPHEVSVVGSDDAPAARYALVPLSTVSYPIEPIGHQVVEFITSRFAGFDGPSRHVSICSPFIVRESSARVERAENNPNPPSFATVEEPAFKSSWN